MSDGGNSPEIENPQQFSTNPSSSIEASPDMQTALLTRITSIENTDTLFTKSGRLSVKGRKQVSEIYAEFVASNNENFSESLDAIRQTKQQLHQLSTSDENYEKLNKIINSVRGKLVYDAHYKWAAYRFKRHVDEGVVGFGELVIKESEFYKDINDFDGLNKVFKEYLKSNNKSLWQYIDDQRHKLQYMDVYKEATDAGEMFRNTLAEKTIQIDHEIEQIIENDLDGIEFRNQSEKFGFKDRIKQRLSQLTRKLINKKVVYAATSVAAISGMVYHYIEPIKNALTTILRPTTDKIQVGHADVANLSSITHPSIESLTDLEYWESEKYGGSNTDIYSGSYLDGQQSEIPAESNITNSDQLVINGAIPESQVQSNPEFIKAATLQSDLDSIVEQAPGRWGMYIKEIGSDKVYGVNTDEKFHPASTIKIPIALEFFYWVDKEGLNHNEVLNKIPAGEHRTFKQLLDNMLIDSDEVATEFLTNYLNSQSGYNTNDIMDDWGFNDINIRPRQATAEQMGRLLEDFYSGKLGLSEESKSTLLQILSTPSKDDLARLGAALPQEVRDHYYHKVGTVLGDGGLYTVSDMGIVDLGNGTVYVVVGLSELNNKEEYPDAAVTLQKVGGAAIDAFSAEYHEEEENKQNSSTVYVDEKHANIGRLHNLQIVGERLDGMVIPAGQTVVISDTALANLDEYMTGFAYGSSDGKAAGGGICGVASALAKEAERLGLQWRSEARHLPSDHAPGGLYENLPNGSFSSGKEFSITNTGGEDLVINFSSNYDLQDIPVSGSWDTYLSPSETIGQEYFTASVSLEPTSQEAQVNEEATYQETSFNTEQKSFTPASTAQYKNGEYFKNMQVNLDIATEHVNDYFESNSLSPSADDGFTFSYNEIMNYYQGEGWTQTTGLLGAGACDIATLMYRAIEAHSSQMGNDIQKVDHDNRGHDIMLSDLFTVKKVNHRPYDGMPDDEIAVSSISPTNSWNSNFDIKINSHFLNGAEIPSDLEIKFDIYLDENGNYVAEIQSNYTIEELQKLAGYQ